MADGMDTQSKNSRTMSFNVVASIPRIETSEMIDFPVI